MSRLNTHVGIQKRRSTRKTTHQLGLERLNIIIDAIQNESERGLVVSDLIVMFVIVIELIFVEGFSITIERARSYVYKKNRKGQICCRVLW